MQLIIISPESTIYKGNVNSVTVPGKKGLFTVLNNHAPIISTLSNGKVVYVIKEGEENKIEIESGLIEVKNNKITICVESIVNEQKK